MKLIKKPETPLEYWEIIEELGNLLWHIDLNLANEFLEKSEYPFDEIEEISLITAQMLNEIGEKFGVTRPYGDTKPDLLPNQIYYWDWYKKTKEEFSQKKSTAG